LDVAEGLTENYISYINNLAGIVKIVYYMNKQIRSTTGTKIIELYGGTIERKLPSKINRGSVLMST
jgi:hypothetical protein